MGFMTDGGLLGGLLVLPANQSLVSIDTRMTEDHDESKDTGQVGEEANFPHVSFIVHESVLIGFIPYTLVCWLYCHISTVKLFWARTKYVEILLNVTGKHVEQSIAD